MKKLFAGKGLVTFDTKETVIELNGVKIEAFPSHHLDAMRGLPKQTRKGNTIEVALYPIIANLVSQYGREVHARDIWNTIVEGIFIKGHYDEKKPNQFETEITELYIVIQ